MIFAVFREPCRFSSPSPHRGMWALFRRTGASIGGYENARGDPSGVSRRVSKRRHLSQHPNSFIYEYRRFRKPAKDVVSPPTSSFPPDNCPSRRKVSFCRPHSPSLTTAAPTYAVPSKLRQCHWSNAPPRTPLALNKLAGVRVRWVVRRRANGGVNTPPLLETPAVA